MADGAAVGVGIGLVVGVAEARTVGVVVVVGVAVERGSAVGVSVGAVPLDGAQPVQVSRAISIRSCCFRQLATPGSSDRAFLALSLAV